MQFIRVLLKRGIFLLALLWGRQVCSYAQEQTDTIWVVHERKNIYIRHTVERGETLFMLAARFGAPAAATAHLNDLSYSDGLPEGSVFKIPVGKFNYVRINSMVNSRPIYYKVQENDRLRTVSRLFNVSQSTIQRWNHLPLPEIFAAQALQVGWVKFDKSKQPFAAAIEKTTQEHVITRKVLVDTASDSTIINKSDRAEVESELGKQFHEKNQGKVLQETSGAAVFFKTQFSEETNVCYAFFDDAPRGTILSIFNPASKKVVYAKVIGPLPEISKYHNARLGLSANAAKVLQAHSLRIFVKVKY